MLCPSNCPLNIDVHTNTSVPIVCIALANCHVRFVITAKQALEARTISEKKKKNYFRTKHVCLRLSSKALDPGMDWIPSLKIKENKQSMNKTISSWDEPWDLLFPKEVLIVYLMIQRCLRWERASRSSTISRSSTERRCERDLQLPQLLSLVLTDVRTWFNEIWGYDHCLSLFVLLFGSLN